MGFYCGICTSETFHTRLLWDDVNFYFLNHLVCANLLVFISSRFTDSFSESWFAMDPEKVPHFASAQEEARYWRLKAEEFQRM